MRENKLPNFTDLDESSTSRNWSVPSHIYDGPCDYTKDTAPALRKKRSSDTRLPLLAKKLAHYENGRHAKKLEAVLGVEVEILE